MSNMRVNLKHKSAEQIKALAKTVIRTIREASK